MNLPPMCPANTSSTIVHVHDNQCWICFVYVDPADPLGLCVRCATDLRAATNEGDLQELVA